MTDAGDAAAGAPRRVLLLGGIAPSGGAGIPTDATVTALHGAQPLPVVIAWTVQDQRAFRACEPLAAATWLAALAAAADGGVDAVKVGLVADAASAASLAQALAPLRVPIVVDPVLSATAGGYAPGPGLARAYREHLLPLATVFTPNLPELDAVCAGDAGQALAAGARAVLVKGGHGVGPFADDVLWHGGSRVTFRRPRLPCGAVRGTGCALASAVAARLALGDSVPAACEGAGDWLAGLLRELGPARAQGLPRTLPFAGGAATSLLRNRRT